MFVESDATGKSVNESLQAPPEKAKEPEPAARVEPPMPSRARTLEKLDQRIDMKFPEPTPLSDILKYIKEVSQGPNDAGFPIYVDPIGLADAEQTMASPVTLNLDKTPLATTLNLILKPLGLAYFVQKEGLLCITSEEDAEAEAEADSTSKILKELAAIRKGLAAIQTRLSAIESGASKDGTIKTLKAELELLLETLKPKEIAPPAPAASPAPKPAAPKPKP